MRAVPCKIDTTKLPDSLKLWFERPICIGRADLVAWRAWVIEPKLFIVQRRSGETFFVHTDGERELTEMVEMRGNDLCC